MHLVSGIPPFVMPYAGVDRCGGKIMLAHHQPDTRTHPSWACCVVEAAASHGPLQANREVPLFSAITNVSQCHSGVRLPLG